MLVIIAGRPFDWWDCQGVRQVENRLRYAGGGPIGGTATIAVARV